MGPSYKGSKPGLHPGNREFKSPWSYHFRGVDNWKSARLQNVAAVVRFHPPLPFFFNRGVVQPGVDAPLSTGMIVV